MIKQRQNNGNGKTITQNVDYSGVDWDFPDAEIARQLNITREGVRQARQRFEAGKPIYFRVRMKSMRQEEILRRHWTQKTSVADVVNLLNISHSKAYRLLKKHNLSFVDGRSNQQ